MMDFSITELTRKAVTTTSLRTFLTAGGGVLVLSFLLASGQQVLALVSGDRPQWQKPFARLGFFAFLLGSYTLIVPWTLSIVQSFGRLDESSQSVEQRFVDRYVQFQQIRDGLSRPPEDPDAAGTTSESWFPSLSMEGFKLSLMQWVTELTYVLTLALVFMLKHFQHYLLLVIINFGPVLIAFASLHPFFHVLAVSWFWSLVEVSAWGWTMQLLLQALAVVPERVGSLSGGMPTLAQHMMTNLTFTLLLVSVPVVTAMMIRGQSASSLGQRVAMVALAGAAVSMSAMKNGATAVEQGIRSRLGGGASAASSSQAASAPSQASPGGPAARSDDPAAAARPVGNFSAAADPRARRQAYAIKSKLAKRARSDD
ncbi:MAG: hypothetical protein ABIJ09_17620 [Pseudomonadota bacterium]